MTLRPPARPVGKRRQYADMAEGTGASYARHQQTVDRPAGESGSLSPRQHEVLFWIAEGLTDDRIAEQIGLSRQTVLTHVRAACRNLGAKNRAHAVALGFRRRLLDLDRRVAPVTRTPEPSE